TGFHGSAASALVGLSLPRITTARLAIAATATSGATRAVAVLVGGGGLGALVAFLVHFLLLRLWVQWPAQSGPSPHRRRHLQKDAGILLTAGGSQRSKPFKPLAPACG